MKEKIKHIITRLLVCALLAVAMVLNVGCGPDNVIEPETPLIVAQTITNGSVGVSAEPRDLVILFDREVILVDAAAVTLSPAVNYEVTVEKDILIITLREPLEYLTDYLLVIGEGTVKDKLTDGPNLRREIAFTTEKGPYVPPTEKTMVLVNPNATYEAQQVYTFLWSVYGKASLSAAMANPGWNRAECEWVYEWTGHYPAIASFDYLHLHLSPNGGVDYTDITEAQEHWRAGGLVSIDWNWMVPLGETSKQYATEAQKTGYNLKNIAKEGSWEWNVMMAGLKKAADMLLLLKDAGIPVIWRPIPCAAAKVSWWGVAGAESYIKLWQTMYDYFAERGVDNLIWVWSSVGNDFKYYPGEEYVDMVTITISNKLYPKDVLSLWNSANALFPHKMIGLAGFGNLPTIPSILDAEAQLNYFMPLSDKYNDYTEGYAHSYATMEWWKATMADERILNLNHLVRNKTLSRINRK
ncbi:MAG: hypothetical protein IKB03_00865 [Tidjanibacter sp.]|nr:hypothetical protein [Tidjanibacter sp.]